MREVAPLQADSLYRAGGIYILHSDNAQILAYTRSYKDRESLMVFNFSDQSQKSSIPMVGYHFPFDLPGYGYTILPRYVPDAGNQIGELKRSLESLDRLGQAA